MDTNFNNGITVRAGQDLSVAGAQFKVVTLAGTIAATPQTAIGLNQTKTQSGEHATVGVLGVMKGYAGAAINSGAALTVTTSGFLITHTPVASGSVVAVGRALVQAASGDLFKGMFNFINGGLTAVGSA